MTCLTSHQLLEGSLDPEVEAHLDGCEACRRRAAELLRGGGPAPALATTETSARLLSAGESVGRYLVLDVVGLGASAVVYAAYDPRLDRKVALKVLRRSVDQSSSLSREAQTIARFQHPNIVVIHDTGLHQGQLYFALDYIEGGHFAEWLAARPRSWRDILECCIEAGHGLAAAHQGGLVHRDFKPANILVGQDNVPRVTDFGLALLDTPEDSTQRRLIGTPAYMAPEQLAGRPADALSDQFAFCVTLWEALAGTRPFISDSVEALRASMRVPPSPPREPDAPRWLWQVLSKGLSFEPSSRFPSMEALLRALDVETHTRARARRFTFAALAALALVVAGAATWLHDRSTRCDQTQLLATLWNAEVEATVHQAFLATTKPYAEAAFQSTSRALRGWVTRYGQARQRVCEAALHNEFTATERDLRLTCLERRSLSLVALRKLLEKAEATDVDHALEAAKGLGAPAECETIEGTSAPVASALVEQLYPRLAHVRALNDSGRYTEARDLARVLVTDAERGGARELQAEAHQLLAFASTGASETENAEKSLYAAIALGEESHHDRLVTKAWISLVNLQGMVMEHSADAHRSAQVAEARLARQPDKDLLFRFHSALGNTLFYEGHVDQASVEYRKSFEVLGPLTEENELDYGAALNHLGIVADEQGHFDEAMKAFEKALEIDRRLRGPNHPSVATDLTNLGALHYSLNHFERALDYFSESLAIREKVLIPTHRLIALNLGNVCSMLNSLDRQVEALPKCERAVAIAEKLANRDDLATTLSNLGAVQEHLGQLDQAEHSYRQSLAIREATHGPTHPGLTNTLINLGHMLVSKHPDEAVAMLERALELRKAAENDPTDTAEAELMLGQTLLELRRGSARGQALLTHAKATIADAGESAADLRELEATWEKQHPDLAH